MEVIDIILLIPLLWFGVKGFINGLIVELASFIAFIAAAFLAFKFSGYVVSKLELTGFSGKMVPILAIILTFVVVYFLIKLLSKVLDKIASSLALGVFTKIGGFVFGVLKAALFTGVVLMLLDIADSKQSLITPQERQKSFLYKPVRSVADFCMPEIKQLAKEIPEKVK